MPPQTLKTAIELAKTGKKEEAKQILAKILDQEPENELAYFWYLDTLPGNQERIKSLEEFLKKHPDHERAGIALEALRNAITAKKPDAKPAKKEAVIDGVIVTQEKPAQPKPLSGEEMSTAALKQRQRKQAQKIKKKKPRRTGLKILLVLVLISAIAASYFIPIYLNNQETITPEQRYALDMEPIIELINEYMDGPVADWSRIMSEQVYQTNESTYREMLYYNMKMGYSDVLISRELTPIVRQISIDGSEIMTALSQVEPPTEIMDYHLQVAICIKYEIDWAVALTDFLVNSQTSQLPENPCSTFPGAFSAIKDYVEFHK